MNDLAHFYGNDINTSPTGDLMPIDGTGKGQQRILRRLLTNPGDLIFHPTYGAGLAALVGQLLDVQKVKGLIRGQILQEAAVAKTPEPQIDVALLPDFSISVSIAYNDAAGGGTQTLNFNVSK